MELYFAPLEGITGYTYRNLHHKYYGGVEKYYTPFLSPGPNVGLGPKEIKDVLPENNPGIRLVPQLMTNRAEDFINSARVLKEYGYREVNLNLGCPSGTVVAKKKGSGLLFYPDELEQTLAGIFSAPEVVNGEIEVSIKTRIGKNAPEEWPRLMEIYNRFPIKELIIHPRIQKDFYKNIPNLEVFCAALKESKNQVVYNGDIFTPEECKTFLSKFPSVEKIMLGRGLIRNPQLAEWIKADGTCGPFAPDMKRLKDFHDALLSEYTELMSGDRNVLFRMKELWSYLITMFPDSKKSEKKIKKAVRMPEYRDAVEELFARAEL